MPAEYVVPDPVLLRPTQGWRQDHGQDDQEDGQPAAGGEEGGDVVAVVASVHGSRLIPRWPSNPPK